MNLSDYVLDFLKKKGVKTTFLITGGAVSFSDSLHEKISPMCQLGMSRLLQ